MWNFVICDILQKHAPLQNSINHLDLPQTLSYLDVNWKNVHPKQMCNNKITSVITIL